MDKIQKIVLIGAGNLATQLGLALHEHGVIIMQVYSRTMSSANLLAEKVQAEAIVDLKEITPQADLYIFSVKDDALLQVLQQCSLFDKVLVHTAGSIDMNILQDFSSNYGVFYPLQTFSKSRKVDFKAIPFCIEASSDKCRQQLKQLARLLSSDVRDVDSMQRQSIHLAAVFVCNFVNYMYNVGFDLMQQHDLNFDLLKPLIMETAQKVMHTNPWEAQTGPAVRYDEQVMNKHLDFLDKQKQLKELYSFVSKQIFNKHQNK
ncbi:MAG: Rossmann-like and DUF2520 domain-containing protein [Mangrovibacterium sp.]